ncbi:MAG: carotenoid biosynthesis protein, partial [Halobacteria archaeon]|nr:carotenoid biosynthesis protein [Halobacteria archaeon]
MEDSGISSSEPSPELEKAVRRHRRTIVVIFPLVGAVMLYASRVLEHPFLTEASQSPIVLILANVVMVLPLVVTLLPVIDRKAVVGLVGVSLFSYIIETMGVKTGFPYG